MTTAGATDVDVVVVGAGHQGLVAAVTLASLGHRVHVCEANDEVGGATRSGEVTVPGAVHDLYATNMNLFLGSAFYREHQAELERHGLSFASSPVPYASAFPDGRSLVVHSDPATTAEMWSAHDARDAAGWSRLEELFEVVSDSFLPLSGGPVPSVGAARAVLGALRGRRAGVATDDVAQVVLSSTRALGERYLATPEARSLVAAWGMHLDFAPDVAGGAIFPLLELFLDMRFGMNLCVGGASRVPEALCAMLQSRGGAVGLADPVVSIEVGADGTAAGVTLASGERIRARRGVVSAVPVTHVARMLGAATPASMRSTADRYRYGPGTAMVHLALDAAIPWADPGLGAASYVHVGPYVDDMAQAYQQAMAGLLPEEPLLVVGQTSVVDPSRRGDGGEHVVWIQARAFPGRVTGDALGETTETDWAALRERIGDRIIAKLERYAPGLTSSVVARTVMTPADLEAGNASLVGGDSLSGSHHLDQFVGLRPSIDLARYRTPVAGLYLAGAGSWPGAGVNATSGALAARALHADTSTTLGSAYRRVRRGLDRRTPQGR